jgi:hypothetical protein
MASMKAVLRFLEQSRKKDFARIKSQKNLDRLGVVCKGGVVYHLRANNKELCYMTENSQKRQDMRE